MGNQNLLGREGLVTPDTLATHAITRALERYGIAITWADLRVLEGRVAAGDGGYQLAPED